MRAPSPSILEVSAGDGAVAHPERHRLGRSHPGGAASGERGELAQRSEAGQLDFHFDRQR